MFLYLLTSSASFLGSVSIVIIVYPGISKVLESIDSVLETILVGTVGKLSNDYIFLVSVSACLPPTTSYEHCSFVLYFVC